MNQAAAPSMVVTLKNVLFNKVAIMPMQWEPTESQYIDWYLKGLFGPRIDAHYCFNDKGGHEIVLTIDAPNKNNEPIWKRRNKGEPLIESIRVSVSNYVIDGIFEAITLSGISSVTTGELTEHARKRYELRDRIYNSIWYHALVERDPKDNSKFKHTVETIVHFFPNRTAKDVEHLRNNHVGSW